MDRSLPRQRRLKFGRSLCHAPFETCIERSDFCVSGRQVALALMLVEGHFDERAGPSERGLPCHT